MTANRLGAPGRLTSILLFVLSLSFLAYAAAAASEPQALAVRGEDPGALVQALVDVNAHLNVDLDACASLADVSAAADLVAHIIAEVNVVADVAAKVGTKIDVSEDIKAKIVAEVAALIQVIVKICATLVAKLGATVALSHCVQLDAILKICLFAVDSCVSGVLALCVKLLVDINAKVLLDLHLDLCAHILGYVKINALGALGIAP